MNHREIAGGADASLDEWQRAESAKRERFRMRLMLHGGDPSVSERLDGRTKREQIREALEALPFVEEVVFARDPRDEPTLFDACHGTIILIERNAAQSGARYELALHVGQRNVARKLFVFIPDNDRAPELEGDGFFATLVRDRVKRAHRYEYSDREYEQCHLVQVDWDFVADLRTELIEEIAAPPPR